MLGLLLNWILICFLKSHKGYIQKEVKMWILKMWRQIVSISLCRTIVIYRECNAQTSLVLTQAFVTKGRIDTFFRQSTCHLAASKTITRSWTLTHSPLGDAVHVAAVTPWLPSLHLAPVFSVPRNDLLSLKMPMLRRSTIIFIPYNTKSSHQEDCIAY